MKDSILFTSNCFGEDRSAALIARELQGLLRHHREDFRVMGASLISEGKDYTSRGVDLLHSSFIPPSGGFPTRSLKGFLADVFSGSIGTVFRFIKSLKQHAPAVRLCVVVGDVSLLFLTRQALPTVPIVFLAPAKSDYMEPHYAVEEWYFNKHTDVILTHDAYTATNLQKKNIRALFLGNPMVDELEPTTSLLSLSETLPVVTLLPGSREEAYDNFVLMLPVVERVHHQHDCHYVVALPSSLTDSKIVEKVAPHDWEYVPGSPFPTLKKDSVSVMLTRGIFPETLHASTVVLGLAGTANEQAAALGKPVVAFRGTGPQTTHKRFEEQHRLLGDALAYRKDYPHGVVEEILLLLKNPEERKRRGAIGQERMGPAGGAHAIASYIVEQYIL